MRRDTAGAWDHLLEEQSWAEAGQQLSHVHRSFLCALGVQNAGGGKENSQSPGCLLYTSDAADEVCRV